MAEFTPEIADDVLAACTAGAEEVGQGLSRSLDAEFTLAVGEKGTWNAENQPAGFDGPGLVVILSVGEQAAIVLLPESSELLPAWYSDPDPTGESKLMTLAQELGMLLLPEEFMPEDFKAAGQANLSEAVARGGLVENAGTVELSLTSGEKTGSMLMIWPAATASEIIQSAAVDESAANESATDEVEQTAAASEPAAVTRDDKSPQNQITQLSYNFEEDVELLPPYTRSLLKINLTLSVTLAEKKQSVSKILSLGAGSIIQFDKMCDETLDLEIGDQKVAQGEAVKVGDKFGLRITAITLPKEKFKSLKVG